MHDGASQNGHGTLQTPASVTRDLLERHERSGSGFKRAVIVLAVLFAVGVVGFVLRFADGFDDASAWGYHAALFAFILASAQAAPMVAIVPRLAKAHWRRPISRAAELFAVVGILNLLIFIPLLWVLPSMEDGRRTLWFFGDLRWPAYTPHVAATLALLALVVVGLMLLWVSSLPDLAAIRDSSEGGKKRFAAWLAHGWHGTSRQWHMQYHRLGILGAFYFMMLVFVHFLIAVDFNMALIPGWIDALFPATQAHNALQAGVAIAIIGMFLLRKFGGWGDYIGLDQFWALGKLLFALSLLWFWFWFSSFNILWYGAKPNERAAIELTMVGPYLWAFMAAFILLFVVPLFAMIWNPLRKSIWGPTIIAFGVLIGLLLDRVRLYVAAYSVDGIGDPAVDKHHALEHIPGTILPGLPDVMIWVGGLAGIALVYMLASRIFPLINIWEQKELLLYKKHKPFHRTEVLVLGKKD